MRVDQYKPELYNTFRAWWEDKGLPRVDEDFLPPRGLIVCEGPLVLCMGFLAVEGEVGAIGNIVGNPLIPKQGRDKALDLLLESLMSHAKALGLSVVIASTNVPALQARYEKHGFFVTDRNVTHYGRRL